MRGYSTQYQPMRSPMPEPGLRSGRASPSPNAIPEPRSLAGRASPAPGGAMPESRMGQGFYQQRGYQSQRQGQYESHTSQYTKSTLDYGRNPLPGSYPTPMATLSSDTSIKDKNSWLEEARESTANFKKNGSPLPLVWVLVENKTIPPNAVPFGEDRNGNTLFIARAYLEGGLHIGRVSHTSGAIFSFVGKEHSIEKYEVLVCASQLRWGLASQDTNGTLTQGTVILARQEQGIQELSRTKTSNFRQELGRTKTVSSRTGSSSWSRETQESMLTLETTLRVGDIPRFIPPQVQEEQLRRIAGYKTVVLIDDSISMTEGDSWHQVGEALAGIVDIAMQYGSKGLDLHFMHEDQYAPNMKTRYDVLKLFDQYGPYGEDTPTGAKLSQIIDMYLPLIEHPSSTHEPISIIVITDGAATDGEELVRCIVEAAARLDRQRVELDRFGIQFLQIGIDEEAARALQVLDDELSDRYKIRDIVDATPFDPTQGSFSTDYMLKIFIGSLNKELDNAPTEVLSPERRPGNRTSPISDSRPPPPRPTSPYVPVGNLL